MIEKERIEAIKRDIDLAAFIESRGIMLKKNGKGYTGLCPFHEDTNPSLSINPQKNLWQCFGCGTGGDIIRFVELFDKLSFPEAVKKLNSQAQRIKGTACRDCSPNSPQKAQPSTNLTIKEQKLLARVVGYYQHTLTQDQQGLRYLKEERGIADPPSISDFGTGYVNGTLPDILPDDEEALATLKKIGILNAKGHETFYNCIVFPLFDSNGGIVNLYGRNITEDPSTGSGQALAKGSGHVSHLYLPGARNGIINRQAVKRSQTIILTESVIDALTLYAQGFKNVIPVYGVNGLLDDHLTLFKGRIKEAYITFDADEAGIKGAEALALRLKEKEIAPHIVNLPVKDVNVFFKRHTPEEFESLLKKANPGSLEQSDKISKREQSLYQETEHGFIVGYGNRYYEIKGIQRSDTQLKATLKASKDISVHSKMPFELTTIDLYSSRSRQWFAKAASDIFGAGEELIKEDLGKLMTLAESYRPKDKKANITEATAEEKAEAERYLKNPDLFKEILDDLETIGVTGEETNKLVGYLAAVSRKLDEPLSILIQSRSAAGKSTLQDAILSLVPEEDFVKYTRMTDQALFYKAEDSLVNKIIAIEEEEGMGGAAYSIRNIQSAKKITVAATGKDTTTGKMRTEEYTVRGPVAVMITTTAAELEGETASRFLFLTIDESTKMTEAIHHKQREADTLAGLIKKNKKEKIIKKHHTAQRLLKPLAVVNPFSQYLSYPTGSLRTRRDHKKYLNLIRAIAFLFQSQREIKTIQVDSQAVEYIEVTLDDIDKANRLANEVLGQSMDELAKPSRTLLSLISQMVKEETEKSGIPLDQFFFNRRMIREYINWTDWQIRAHIRQLEEMEYLYIRMGNRGKEYSYALQYKGQAEDEGRFYLNLTPVAEIKKHLDG